MKTPVASGLACLVLSSASLLAQSQTIVSPQPASATVEGTLANNFPLVTNILCRYMQVHSDVGGLPKVIRKVAFRRNGAAAPQPTGRRTVDLEMRLGHSVAWNAISYVFASNWIGTPTLVLPRQVLNIGPLTAIGSPAPFEMAVPLATPFVYNGLSSLAFEMVHYSNTDNGLTAQQDTESGTSTTGALPTLTGTGCLATGRATVMDMDVQHMDRGGAYQFGAYVKNAPANAPTLVFFGGSNPNLPVPGLCSNLLTDLVFSVYAGNADATGYLGERGVSATGDYPSARCTFVLPNTIGGAVLYAQAHAIDANRSDAIKICNSSGRRFVVPMPGTAIVAKASRLYNFQLQGPAYPHATPLTLAHGYAAVTEFTY